MAAVSGPVLEVLEQVTSEDVAVYQARRVAEDRSAIVRTFLASAEKQAEQERDLRERFGYRLLICFFAQIAALNCYFILIGLEWITVNQWVATTFITGTFAELAAMVFFIIKFLFGKAGLQIESLIAGMKDW